DRIDVVVLGMLQHELGVGAHLHRLEDNDNKAVRPQERNHRLFITPTCCDPNALDLALPQPGRQAPIARGAIVDLQLIRAFVDRYVQLVLACIDPGAHGAILAHLLRPFLVMRTLGSFNHPGPMKSRSRSCSAAALVARERTIRRPATCSGCAPGAGHSSRNARTIPIRANTRSRRRRRLEAWPQTRGCPHGSRRFAPHHEGGSRAVTLSTNPLRSGEQAGMNRREFITLIAGAAAAWPLAARAQQGATRRIAIFHPAIPTTLLTETGGGSAWRAFFGELRRLGYVEGENLIIERYSAEGHHERYADLAREIVSRNPDVIVTGTNPVVIAFKAATSTIP